MHNDGMHAAISTGGGLAAYLATFSVLVPILWAVYVLILIAIKLPELYDKNPLFRRVVDRVASIVRWRRGA
ncbi:hypothetical protein H0A73_17535 [Alcaligenaceae bacterium]|nr:hypothetical protein [Alcaligenaceae bacterium]